MLASLRGKTARQGLVAFVCMFAVNNLERHQHLPLPRIASPLEVVLAEGALDHQRCPLSLIVVALLQQADHKLAL